MNQLKSIARRLLTARGFLPDFSDAALAEASAAAAPSAVGEGAVRDQRGLLWASIDNDSSRDLDQLSVAEALPNGVVKVLVAIADVDAVVKRGSAVDQHAATNTVSVYTAAAIFPMLPERLSTDITSLGEKMARLALVIEFELLPDGSLGKSDVYRAWVQSQAKLAYNSVAAWLEEAQPAPERVAAVNGLAEQLRMQDAAAQVLRKQRFLQGALSLQTPQAEAVFSGDQLTDLRTDSPNRAKELIEDFMVAANGVVARFLSQKGFPSVRRVLRSPERWARIVTLAQDLGEALPAQPDGAALSQFLAKRRQEAPAKFPDLSLSIVKLLGRGLYVVDLPGQAAIGHFGLAANDYGHSTAPNRRFPDLITQRLLKAALLGAPVPYTSAELQALAAHCNDQEANAAKVERQVEKSAAAQLLSARIGERFDGIVTGAADKGTWVRVNHPAVEGKVVRGAQGLDVGDRVRVELLHVDVEQGFIDFAAAGAA
jgi:VacB/RNase II family 3'-5' exoribonuclease